MCRTKGWSLQAASIFPSGLTEYRQPEIRIEGSGGVAGLHRSPQYTPVVCSFQSAATATESSPLGRQWYFSRPHFRIMTTTASINPSTGEKTLRTLRNMVTLDEALEEEHDMLQKLTYWDKRIQFLRYLRSNSAEIEAIVSYHLGIRERRDCELAPLDDWIHGSFNMCVPVYVKNWKKCLAKRVMIRFPLPYKVGEENFPGNAEEKLRCEAATYIWIHENCPDVPIPQLLGFAFDDNQCVSHTGTGARTPRTHCLPTVHILRKYLLVYSTHRIFSPTVTRFVSLSSYMSIYLPPPAVQLGVWISVG